MDDPPTGTLISTREAYAGRLLKIDIETIRNPAGQTVELEVVRHHNALDIRMYERRRAEFPSQDTASSFTSQRPSSSR